VEVTPRKIALLPEGRLATALGPGVVAAGAEVTADLGEADGLVWCNWRPAGLKEALGTAPGLVWVQLPYAGIEEFVSLLDDKHVWTCAKGVYGPAVAEFALALLLAGLRGIDRYSRERRWEPHSQQTLAGSKVAILGAGGIGRSLAEMLAALEAEPTVVSRSGSPLPTARTLPQEQMLEAVKEADAVVLALPLTQATRGLVDRPFLDSMKDSAWLVNVARGQVVVTADLVEALEEGRIGGAALDVTDPEPLPPGHRLYELDNAIVTPHVANTSEIGTAALFRLVSENVRRFQAGEHLLGKVDPVLGY
jgi:phosphoglycerate dehydrogenase-like enzyme